MGFPLPWSTSTVPAEHLTSLRLGLLYSCRGNQTCLCVNDNFILKLRQIKLAYDGGDGWPAQQFTLASAFNRGLTVKR